MKKLAFILLLAASSIASAETWSVIEGADNEWVGQWTRQGSTNNFNAWWKSSKGSSVTATIIITESGDAISVRKVNSGNDCNYSGIRRGDSIEGTYFCKNGGPYNWFARISHL
jgi:hypothetical protein